jgi:hypothetical protein
VVKKRNSLKSSRQSDVKEVWAATSPMHINSDAFLSNDNLHASSVALKKSQIDKAACRFFNLKSQGSSSKTVCENVPKSNILIWDSNLFTVSNAFHNFDKKSLQNLLPTSVNLFRWKRINDPACALCAKGITQTNKHLLSNCDSPAALNRYKIRHDAVLEVIATWIQSLISAEQTLHVDIATGNFKQISDIFNSDVRPDIAIVKDSQVFILELTVCLSPICKNLSNTNWKNIVTYRGH